RDDAVVIGGPGEQPGDRGDGLLVARPGAEGAVGDGVAGSVGGRCAVFEAIGGGEALRVYPCREDRFRRADVSHGRGIYGRWAGGRKRPVLTVVRAAGVGGYESEVV